MMLRSRRAWMLETIAAAAIAGSPARGSGPREARENTASPRAPLPVAIVLGNHATFIDFAGPWEILGAASYVCPGFDVRSVADTLSPVLCDDGRSTMTMANRTPASAPHIIPDYTFDNVPQPRIVIIGAQPNPSGAAIAWIRRVAKNADLVASVCTGAFVLAGTGLLDGRNATTNRNAYDRFEKTFPRVKLVRGVRFVDEGNVASATGLTAGIDLALHIVRRFYGAGAAAQVAAYEEWTPRN